MQPDGNLVLYAPGNVPTWASETRGTSETILRNQRDGNIVLIARNNAPVWETGTDGASGTRLIVQNDGNLVAYRDGVAVWSSGTR